MEKLAIGVRFIGALFLRHIYVCKLADTYMYRYVSGSQPVDHQHDYTQWHHSRPINLPWTCRSSVSCVFQFEGIFHHVLVFRKCVLHLVHLTVNAPSVLPVRISIGALVAEQILVAIAVRMIQSRFFASYLRSLDQIMQSPDA